MERKMRITGSSSNRLALVGSIILAAAVMLFSACKHNRGIVASIEKAPVIADGNVTGMPTDIVINLEGSLDQSVPGRSLAAGDTIKVVFPPQFDLANLNPAYPLSDVPVPGSCVPGSLTCSTAVILRGWPQDPYFPPSAFATYSIDPAENAFVFTAVQDMGPPADNLGIKQLHIMLHGVNNPKPGRYKIHVEAQTGDGGALETGYGLLQVLPRTRPSINITSVLVNAWKAGACGPGKLPPNPDNPIFQSTTTGAAAPFAWTFLLWGRNNEALTDVGIEWTNPDRALLKRNGDTIGHIVIDAPDGAVGYGIQENPLGCGTFMPFAPVIATTAGIGPQEVGRMDMLFHTGDKTGDYVTTLRMNNGNAVQMTVTAE